MKITKKIPRDRNIEGRADGYIFFNLKWSDQTFSHRSRHSKTLETTIRIFRERLKLIPPDQLPTATAKIEVTVRKKSGNVKRITLAQWDGSSLLENFIDEARKKWQILPKETEDNGTATIVNGSELFDKMK